MLIEGNKGSVAHRSEARLGVIGLYTRKPTDMEILMYLKKMLLLLCPMLRLCVNQLSATRTKYLR